MGVKDRGFGLTTHSFFVTPSLKKDSAIPLLPTCTFMVSSIANFTFTLYLLYLLGYNTSSNLFFNVFVYKFGYGFLNVSCSKLVVKDPTSRREETSNGSRMSLTDSQSPSAMKIIFENALKICQFFAHQNEMSAKSLH